MSENNLVQRLVDAVNHAIGDAVLIISSDDMPPKSMVPLNVIQEVLEEHAAHAKEVEDQRIADAAEANEAHAANSIRANKAEEECRSWRDQYIAAISERNKAQDRASKNTIDLSAATEERDDLNAKLAQALGLVTEARAQRDEVYDAKAKVEALLESLRAVMSDAMLAMRHGGPWRNLPKHIEELKTERDQSEARVERLVKRITLVRGDMGALITVCEQEPSQVPKVIQAIRDRPLQEQSMFDADEYSRGWAEAVKKAGYEPVVMGGAHQDATEGSIARAEQVLDRMHRNNPVRVFGEEVLEAVEQLAKRMDATEGDTFNIHEAVKKLGETLPGQPSSPGATAAGEIRRSLHSKIAMRAVEWSEKQDTTNEEQLLEAIGEYVEFLDSRRTVMGS